jgi:hypothetical protein
MAKDEIEALRAEVRALRDEVRTRRLVVVDSAGRPRVVLSADPGVGSVRVDAEGGDPSVELYAVDAIEADGPEVGLALVVRGEVVTSIRHGPGPRP